MTSNVALRGSVLAVLTALAASTAGAQWPGAQPPGSEARSTQIGSRKSVTTGEAAIRGSMTDSVGETYGVAGISASPAGAGLAAANTGGGADLRLDGAADGQPDTILTQGGIDRPSGSVQVFGIFNSAMPGGMVLEVGGDVAAESFVGNGSGLTGLQWESVVGVPPDIADGDDDALAALGCGEAQVAKWTGWEWVCGTDVGVPYARTMVVCQVGDQSQNGESLLVIIEVLPEPGDLEESRLLKIEPGVYDLGEASLVMKSWMDIEGSGERTTVIRSHVCELALPDVTVGTVVVAAHSELRLLTVVNTCAGSNQQAAAIFNGADHAGLRHVVARTVGAADYNYGVANTGSDVLMGHVTAFATGAAVGNVGMATSGDRVRIGDGSATGLGGGWSSRGLIIEGSEVVVTDVFATAREGTVDNHGVSVAGAGITLTDVTATADSVPTADIYGVYGLDASFRMAGGVAEGGIAVYLEATPGSESIVVLDHAALNGASAGLAVFDLSLIHISEPTRQPATSRMPSSA